MNRWIGQYRGVLVRLPRLSGASRMIFPGNEGVDSNGDSFYSSYKMLGDDKFKRDVEAKLSCKLPPLPRGGDRRSVAVGA